MKVGRKPEYPEKTPGVELHEIHLHVAVILSNRPMTATVFYDLLSTAVVTIP